MPKFRVERTPLSLSNNIPSRGDKRLILGLDLGTTSGFACGYYKPGSSVEPGDFVMYLGQLDLGAGPYDSGAIRFVRLRQYLHVIKPDLVAFEDVRYTPADKPTRFNVGAILARAATACEWFGALKATTSSWCEEHGVPCVGIPIGTIKKRATGKGNANKVDMIRSCNDIYRTDFDTESYETTGVDNIADAAFVCQLAIEQYGDGLSPVVDNHVVS